MQLNLIVAVAHLKFANTFRMTLLRSMTHCLKLFTAKYFLNIFFYFPNNGVPSTESNWDYSLHSGSRLKSCVFDSLNIDIVIFD